jgi:hypothetical protein
MQIKKYFAIALSLCLALSATGCGEKFPELTEEQYKQTVEFAAGLLMKYSNNGQERLVYVDAAEIEKQKRKMEAKEKEEEETKTAPEPVAPKPVAEPEPVIAEAEEGDDTGEILTGEDLVAEVDAGQDTSSEQEEEPVESANEAVPGARTLSADETQEITDDIFLSYQGYMVSSTYPESSKSYVVNADKGKKLLVLRFDLYNASDATKKVNMIPLNLLFQIILNGNNLGYSSVTFLPNDLSSFSGEIESRAHESVVVLTQISEKDSTSIQNLGMIVSIKGKNQTVNLK